MDLGLSTGCWQQIGEYGVSAVMYTVARLLLLTSISRQQAATREIHLPAAHVITWYIGTRATPA